MKKKRRPLDVAVDLFSRVPEVVRVEANIEDDLWERVGGVDFTFVVDADWHEAAGKIIPLLSQFMRETDIGVDCNIRPSDEEREPRKMLVFSREDERDLVETRRAPGQSAT